jgi:hypothetical protein
MYLKKIYRYRFTRAIDMKDLPFFRSNKKYFRFIDYYTARELLLEGSEDIDDDSLYLTFDVYEV